jgi:hypothetical protein
MRDVTKGGENVSERSWRRQVVLDKRDGVMQNVLSKPIPKPIPKPINATGEAECSVYFLQRRKVAYTAVGML